MLRTVAAWLGMKWRPRATQSMLGAYQVTFSTPHGQLVLQDLMDTIYCTVYEGTDPYGAVAHNAQRSVVQGILENIDRAQNPAKYIVHVDGNGAERNASLV